MARALGRQQPWRGPSGRRLGALASSRQSLPWGSRSPCCGARACLRARRSPRVPRLPSGFSAHGTRDRNRSGRARQEPEQIAPTAQQSAGKRLAAVQARGTLRMGWPSEQLPWASRNAGGHLVSGLVSSSRVSSPPSSASDSSCGLRACAGGAAPSTTVTSTSSSAPRDGSRTGVAYALSATLMSGTLAFFVRDLRGAERCATIPVLRQTARSGSPLSASPAVDRRVRARSASSVRLRRASGHQGTSSRRRRDGTTRCCCGAEGGRRRPLPPLHCGGLAAEHHQRPDQHPDAEEAGPSYRLVGTWVALRAPDRQRPDLYDSDLPRP